MDDNPSWHLKTELIIELKDELKVTLHRVLVHISSLGHFILIKAPKVKLIRFLSEVFFLVFLNFN